MLNIHTSGRWEGDRWRPRDRCSTLQSSWRHTGHSPAIGRWRTKHSRLPPDQRTSHSSHHMDDSWLTTHEMHMKIRQRQIIDWSCNRLNWLMQWMIDWLIKNWLVDWMNDGVTRWMPEWWTDWLNGWMNDWMIDSVNCQWMIDWLTNYLIGLVMGRDLGGDWGMVPPKLEVGDGPCIRPPQYIEK